MDTKLLARLKTVFVILFMLGCIAGAAMAYDHYIAIRGQMSTGQIGNFQHLNHELLPLIGYLAGALVLAVLALIASILHDRQLNAQLQVFRQQAISNQDIQQSGAEEQTTSQAQKDQQKTDELVENLRKKADEGHGPPTLLAELCQGTEAVQGIFYLAETDNEGNRHLKPSSTYAFYAPEGQSLSFSFGEGLVGQAAASNTPALVTDIPQGYLQIISGLGQAQPESVVILPVSQKAEVLGVLELAYFGDQGRQWKPTLEAAAEAFAIPEMPESA